MIKNSYISLKPSSANRTDAVNSIKYTLLLDYRAPIIENMENPIPEIMKSCRECCRGLFQDKGDCKIYFDFFGDQELTELTYQKHHELAFLDVFPPYDFVGHNEDGFPPMILDHCVLSCYHAILTEMLHGTEVTSYELKNYLKGKGFYSLYKNKELNLESDKIVFNVEKFTDKKNRQKSSSASDFMRVVETHLKVLPYTKNLFTNADPDNTNQVTSKFPLQFSSLFFNICGIRSNSWSPFPKEKAKPEKSEAKEKDKSVETDKSNKDIPKKDEEPKFKGYKIIKSNKHNVLQRFEDLTDEIFPKTDDNKFPKIPEKLFTNSSGNPVDGLYNCYITERIFNLNLTYSLLNMIIHIQNAAHFDLSHKNMIDLLCCCQNLPNVFSRQYFLQYALDKLVDKPISYLDFWHKHTPYSDDKPYESAKDRNHQFQFARWLEQFELFCNYMSQYVIPIYEWCFTNLLMDVIEQKYPNEQHKQHLLYAIDSLAGYMERNYEKILRPVEVSCNQDWVDIITKHKDNTAVIAEKFSESSLKRIFEALFPNEEKEIELNLAALNPDFFRSHNRGKAGSNETRIRDFYIDLIMSSF